MRCVFSAVTHTNREEKEEDVHVFKLNGIINDVWVKHCSLQCRFNTTAPELRLQHCMCKCFCMSGCFWNKFATCM